MDKIEILAPIAGIIAIIVGVCLDITAMLLPGIEMIIASASAGILILVGIFAILKTL